MAWKIERWLTEVYKNDAELIEDWARLPSRELVIVACATLDVALAELLSLRLVDDPGEVTDFIGADEDGHAPAGSFGARIQLAYLLGILPKAAVRGLRSLKSLRNRMAHRVGSSLLDAKAQDYLETLRSTALAATAQAQEKGLQGFVEDLVDGSRTAEDSARSLVLLASVAIHSGLPRIAGRIQRLEMFSRDDEATPASP
jgi:hypothetical protein